MKKHFIVGTAGHVDHGKTSLIRALTGIETDRLPEEKARGLSIDLGFAHLALPGDVMAGIVDVPGHERFLKNMLAGVGGYDCGLLVVDAQEGVMPQTREHVEILELLQTPCGLVAITKIDAVDEDFLELVRDDLREFLKGTFLADAPLVNVSAKTGAGLDQLRTALGSLLSKRPIRDREGPFRLPIDRAFLKPGFGTVVTGSLWSGQLHKGDRVAGVEPGSVGRGQVLAPPGLLTPTQRVDVRLDVLLRVPREIKHRARVRFYCGTQEVIGRLLLLEDNAVPAGQTALAQIELESPAALLAKDRFILRDFTASYTIGGGVVLTAQAERHRRKDEELLDQLRRQEEGGFDQSVLAALGSQWRNAIQLGTQLQVPHGQILAAIERLVAGGQMVLVGKGYCQKWVFGELEDKFQSILTGLQTQNPWRTGWRKEDLLKLVNHDPPKLAEEALQALIASGHVQERGRWLSLAGHEPRLTPAQQSHLNKVLKLMADSGFSPPNWDEVAALAGVDPPQWRVLEPYLIDTAQAVKLGPNIIYLATTLQLARERLGALGDFTPAQARDALDTSRKYIIPILEYLDQCGFSQRSGEVRKLLPAVPQRRG